MKITLFDINNMYQTIQKISTFNLPLKGAFKLNQIFNVISKDYEFYNKKILEIMKKYSKKDELGNPILDSSKTNVLIQPDKMKECEEEIYDLYNLESEIDDNLIIVLDDLGNIECSIQDLQSLTPILREK